MITVDPDSSRRRLRLRVAAKLMVYLAFAGIVYVFVSALMSGDGKVPDVPSMRVDISQLQPGDIEFVNWQNRPIVIYRRTDGDIEQLGVLAQRLLDANSVSSEQPMGLNNDFRSRVPEWFVAIGLGTGQGCTVELLPASDELFQREAWPGGFIDSCGKDRYDFAGRVIDGQYATRNLTVPLYSIEENTLILGR
ncbi:MAG: hypothetical protein AB8B63_12245 [Granulosicoccus sp.]